MYIYETFYARAHVYVFLFSVKKTRFNYRKFDLSGDLVGVPPTSFKLSQSFITRLKLVLSEFNMVVVIYKNKCVGLQRALVRKHTVCNSYPLFYGLALYGEVISLRTFSKDG